MNRRCELYAFVEDVPHPKGTAGDGLHVLHFRFDDLVGRLNPREAGRLNKHRHRCCYCVHVISPGRLCWSTDQEAHYVLANLDGALAPCVPCYPRTIPVSARKMVPRSTRASRRASIARRPKMHLISQVLAGRDRVYRRRRHWPYISAPRRK